jgi:dTDP-4-amino-4,6-dideoxygalactose transaminase
VIPVTKPFLPPKAEYDKYLEGIWQRNWLTNNGPLVNELELKLKEYLQVPHILYLSNGTIALQIAIKALGLKGEIITTPFSYVATTSSIVWEGCTPVFVDIDPDTLNINPAKIEAAITPRTSGIIATHVYGNPCAIEAIDAIAKMHNLKVIYDAAHAFGVKYKGQSIFTYGDVSTTSFHATKLFHTIEGGAVFTQDPELLKRMAHMRNFGHSGLTTFSGVGINGKNSEFHAAMGLVNLNYVNELIIARAQLHNYYDNYLDNQITKPSKFQFTQHNFAYYPCIFNSEAQLNGVVESLIKNEIFPRRYFYPLLSELPYVEKTKLSMAENLAHRILCLPFYNGLTKEEIHLITTLINKKL